MNCPRFPPHLSLSLASAFAACGWPTTWSIYRVVYWTTRPSLARPLSRKKKEKTKTHTHSLPPSHTTTKRGGVSRLSPLAFFFFFFLGACPCLSLSIHASLYTSSIATEFPIFRAADASHVYIGTSTTLSSHACGGAYDVTRNDWGRPPLSMLDSIFNTDSF